MKYGKFSRENLNPVKTCETTQNLKVHYIDINSIIKANNNDDKKKTIFKFIFISN